MLRIVYCCVLFVAAVRCGLLSLLLFVVWCFVLICAGGIVACCCRLYPVGCRVMLMVAVDGCC